MSKTDLDPADWPVFRDQAHQMLDDMLDHLQHIRQKPVWQPIPASARHAFDEALPRDSTDLSVVHQQFLQHILPYGVGNVHPGFMGWVHGGGTPVGMLADMLAAGLNANLGGRDQMPVEVERQIVRWCAALFGFPASASGVFVTGSSTANLIGLLVARTALLGQKVRDKGLKIQDRTLVAYSSSAAHGCIAQAMEIAGLGRAQLRRIAVNAAQQMDVTALRLAITEDRAAGHLPFFVAATAGTVDVGAIDPLDAIADVAHTEKLWFHVDGAYGALGMLSPNIAPQLQGMQRADSIALDFHKWGQVPYDAGFILVRDSRAHLDTFASPAAYLRREERGIAAGSPWPCDFGPDLSRSFRALKTWFTLKVYGSDQLGAMIDNTCALAQYLKQQVIARPALELLAPVALNIVCFRYRCSDEALADQINAEIVADLHESGIAAPSTTTINGQLAIRAAIVNHRTEQRDIDALITKTLSLGDYYSEQSCIAST